MLARDLKAKLSTVDDDANVVLTIESGSESEPWPIYMGDNDTIRVDDNGDFVLLTSQLYTTHLGD